MLKVTLKNGNEYELLEDTTVYPSGSPNARSRMEIHMGEDAMTTAEFEAAFMDEAATAKIRLTKTTDEDNTKIVFDTVYQHYCLVASIGKKRVSKTDIATGQVVEEMHLVAELGPVELRAGAAGRHQRSYHGGTVQRNYRGGMTHGDF